MIGASVPRTEDCINPRNTTSGPLPDPVGNYVMRVSLTVDNAQTVALSSHQLLWSPRTGRRISHKGTEAGRMLRYPNRFLLESEVRGYQVPGRRRVDPAADGAGFEGRALFRHRTGLRVLLVS